MRTEILTFLRSEEIRNPKLSTVFNLGPFLNRTFPAANPSSVKNLLHKLMADGVCNLSGDFGSLGSSFHGELKTTKDVVIHAQLTDKGREEVGDAVQAPKQVSAPVIQSWPIRTEIKKEPTDQEKALMELTRHITPVVIEDAPDKVVVINEAKEEAPPVTVAEGSINYAAPGPEAFDGTEFNRAIQDEAGLWPDAKAPDWAVDFATNPSIADKTLSVETKNFLENMKSEEPPIGTTTDDLKEGEMAPEPTDDLL